MLFHYAYNGGDGRGYPIRGGGARVHVQGRRGRWRPAGAMGLIRHYLSLILFAAGLLAGVQLPNFVDQYEKRVDAHYREASADLSGFQRIAELYHHGSVEGLIRQHEASSDPSFHSEAAPIRRLYQRKMRYASELRALNTGFVRKVAHVLLGGDPALLRETYAHYSADLPLNVTAMLCGVAVAAAVCALFELILGLIKAIVVFNLRARRAARAATH